MKALLKILVLTAVFTLPAFAMASSCVEKKDFIIKEINGAIEASPNACKSALDLKCRLLKVKLQQLIGVIQKNDNENLHKVIAFINSNKAMINDSIAEDYQKQTNTLLSDLNVYNQQCGK